MAQNGPGNPILGVPLACVPASIILAIIGLVLHRHSMPTARSPALAWAILIAPRLFYAGFAMFTKHGIDAVTGRPRASINEPDVRGAR